MPRPELEFHRPDAVWQPTDRPGIWTQMLSLDPETGDYTRLLRYEPGVDTSTQGTRVHDYWEEVLILDGDLTDLRLNETFTAGMYACRPPGMPHGPWRTDGGVLMLEISYGSRR
ncbi:MAG TPA: cupin domain-containing protein [Chloroflexota bacterium]|nr:cupin domain-containing protein [Chloroflexota bacterium]